MRRLALCLTALMLAGWAPDMLGVATWTETQNLTRAAPTTDATLGISLGYVVSFIVVVTPPANQSLSGGGEIDLYTYNSKIGSSWVQSSSDTVWSMTACAGKTTQCISPVYDGGLMQGRILAAANGVTVSSGTQVTVQIIATTSLKSSHLGASQ